MGKYSENPAWSDVVPLPTNEGGSNPLAAIAYSDEYGETMSYLRAIMAADEYSDRALSLTEHLIGMNPAHYTVWLYRAKILFALKKDLRFEIAWLNDIALTHQKNYQIWHHRNLVINQLNSCDGETEFVEHMFELDAKNYHVWSYRQWLVKRFNLWEEGELNFTERMLEQDVRNNSAWNHRWYIINGRQDQGVAGVATNEAIRQREIEFATAAIAKSPQNQSPWNYLQAIVRQSKVKLDSVRSIAEQYADLSRPDGIKSSHALDMLADILGEKDDEQEQASMLLDLLADTFDPLRKNYWHYRKSLLSGPRPATTATA